jgi:hypothetical protein
MDRRGFISSSIRGGILFGVLAASGYLLFRKDDNKSECNSICRGCDSLQTCAKPEAIKAKKEESK